jgi:hypothetical protein
VHVLIFIAIAYLVIHVLSYKHGRRRSMGFWYSMRGPFRTRWTVSKRL